MAKKMIAVSDVLGKNTAIRPQVVVDNLDHIYFEIHANWKEGRNLGVGIRGLLVDPIWEPFWRVDFENNVVGLFHIDELVTDEY